MECLRCKEELKFLKEYRFDSQEANRGFFKAIFDVEEHLIFKYVLSVNIQSLYIRDLLLGLICKVNKLLRKIYNKCN